MAYWFLYRKFIIPDLPPGGVDIFGCNATVREALCCLPEVGGSLIGLLFLLGFRRKFIPYYRRPRPFGESAWSFARKIRYMFDSRHKQYPTERHCDRESGTRHRLRRYEERGSGLPYGPPASGCVPERLWRVSRCTG